MVSASERRDARPLGKTVLTGQGLAFAYEGGPDVVCGVDLTVATGEVICVLGPNGAGKSTLLRLLAGLAPPATGEVRLGGAAIRSIRPRDRARQIALVPQSLFALPSLTVGEFVGQGRYAHARLFRGPSAADRSAVLRALKDADLVDLEERPLDALSGGQRQRALVARAMAQEPGVVLVDEPTNSLDPRHQIQVFQVIAGLGCEGRAAVVVTHDLNLASQFATRLILMDEGKIVADGSVHEVLRPEVLGPVYGSDLAFGSRRVDGWNEDRPYVIPWRSSPAP